MTFERHISLFSIPYFLFGSKLPLCNGFQTHVHVTTRYYGVSDPLINAAAAATISSSNSHTTKRKPNIESRDTALNYKKGWISPYDDKTNYAYGGGQSKSHHHQPDWKKNNIRRRKLNRIYKQRHHFIPDEERLRRAQNVERQLFISLKRTRNVLFGKDDMDDGGDSEADNDGTSKQQQQITSSSSSSSSPILFPSVRECNAALATFGDNGELLRALRLFVEMRKSASLAMTARSDDVRAKQQHVFFHVPAPNMVTYSTLMSRAVHLGKPRVALRLWRLMRNQTEFFSHSLSLSLSTTTTKKKVVGSIPIVPDVKAANILMNAYAKLADYESAQDLLRQMIDGNGLDVPKMKPNIVTYNTLIDACHRAGELPSALSARDAMLASSILPDARTYTSLISTVARKSTSEYGAYDPDTAFVLLNEMVHERHIRPNAMTYCALIDVCSRCGRSDLALKGLRMMLRQRAKEQKEEERGGERKVRTKKRYRASDEGGDVGAWTAAINACGKAGNTDTAMRLFMAMPNFGVRPNTVTCGCITDCLLRKGRVSDALEVLRYMKEEKIEPSEVMYTSLISHAGRLVKMENRMGGSSSSSSSSAKGNDDLDGFEKTSEQRETSAVEVYKELMGSLMLGSGDSGVASKSTPKRGANAAKSSNAPRTRDSNTLLLKVFLVFQEMKAVGAIPDLTCYNALLKACARAGDVTRSEDILSRIADDDLNPNDITWREMLRTAAKACRSDAAERIWEMAWNYKGVVAVTSSVEEDDYRRWQPDAEAFEVLITSYSRHASTLLEEEHKRNMFQKIVTLYEDVLAGTNKAKCSGIHHVDVEELHQNQRVMLIILRAAVVLELIESTTRAPQTSSEKPQRRRKSAFREMAKDIANLECLRDKRISHHGVVCDAKTMKALQLARIWRNE